MLFQRITGFLGLLTYAVLVLEMARLWIAPDTNDIDRILTLSVMMGFEFIMVHSGVFMAVMPRKLSLFVFIPIYGLFAWAMNGLAPGNTILWLYFGVVFIRMRFAFSNPSETLKSKAMGMSVVAVMLYFFLILGFSIGSNTIPQLGLTPEFLETSGYRDIVTVGGIFTDLPNVPLAMGIVYFSLLAFFEAKIYGLFKAEKR